MKLREAAFSILAFWVHLANQIGTAGSFCWTRGFPVSGTKLFGTTKDYMFLVHFKGTGRENLPAPCHKFLRLVALLHAHLKRHVNRTVIKEGDDGLQYVYCIKLNRKMYRSPIQSALALLIGISCPANDSISYLTAILPLDPSLLLSF